MKKQNVRTLSLIVITLTYLLVGAAVFDALESEHESRKSQALAKIEKKLIEKYSIEHNDYLLLETIVLSEVPYKAEQQWKFVGAFYYATTVLTTIGYGHSTPSTIPGKIFTIFYAMVGIPLCLVLFHSIGERLNKVSSIVIKSIKKLLKCRNTDATEIDLILVVTTLSTITITSGAAVFRSYEGWTYFNSVYYCVITLTTIGFGDMVALQRENTLNEKPEYVAFALVFILFGMAIVAASLNLFVLRFVTMNTEDERRDEAEAQQAAAGAVRLEGDVITANGSILSGQCPQEAASFTDLTSVCSCTCVSCAPCPSLPFRSSQSMRKNPISLAYILPHRRNFRKSQSQHHQVTHTETQEDLCSSSEFEAVATPAHLQKRNSV
ncbi:two pore potassium channel protein sup-9-like [Penaeus monodon]|uniref:two pore potassium channel protein sup-9-like n=1 Tax=Penaeus monodon TaxID=6687 RepID=UPI0018A71160|nr:two pore potassium channel protein sup-9-like [Penaeus monodon]